MNGRCWTGPSYGSVGFHFCLSISCIEIGLVYIKSRRGFFPPTLFPLSDLGPSIRCLLLYCCLFGVSVCRSLLLSTLSLRVLEEVQDIYNLGFTSGEPMLCCLFL
jgi:hypothetical protein